MIWNAHSYLLANGLPMASHDLNSNTWDIISRVSKAGKGADYWSIGDYKLAGQYAATIVGFNQDDGGNSITFALAYPEGGAIKPYFGASIAATNFTPTGRTGPSSTKWTNSAYYRSGGVLSTIRGSLPNDLYSVIRLVSKDYEEVNSQGSYIRTGTYDLFPPSRTEIIGSYSNKYQYWVGGGEIPAGELWLRDAYSYSWYDGVNGVRGIYKFYALNNGSLTNDGYTDKWDYGGETGRTGTTDAGLIVLFVV